ncbi:hypothetical protein [Planctomonas psychrotolerans]|uniref:hypothetical protein n=1 Tax=Planctomonas psychrotolerans TaxID=2528712 RepID=UPI001238A618|nr:hypothetical protein [Planctomonas psychrotolerans]
MKNKLIFVVGAGVGYVLGARAGRKSYDQIAAKASALWNDEKVQKTVSDVESFVKDKAPVVQQKISDSTKGAVGKVTGKSSSSTDTSSYSASSSVSDDNL